MGVPLPKSQFKLNGNLNDSKGISNIQYSQSLPQFSRDREQNIESSLNLQSDGQYLDHDANYLQEKDFSICLWIKAVSGQDSMYNILSLQFNNDQPDSNTPNKYLDQLDINKENFIINYVSSDYQSNLNELFSELYWTFLSVIFNYSSKEIKIYSNGIPMGSFSNPSSNNSEEKLSKIRIGSKLNHPNYLSSEPSQVQQFFGLLDDIQVYETTLSLLEIRKLENQLLAELPIQTELKAHYTLDNTLKDKLDNYPNLLEDVLENNTDGETNNSNFTVDQFQNIDFAYKLNQPKSQRLEVPKKIISYTEDFTLSVLVKLQPEIENQDDFIKKTSILSYYSDSGCVIGFSYDCNQNLQETVVQNTNWQTLTISYDKSKREVTYFQNSNIIHKEDGELNLKNINSIFIAKTPFTSTETGVILLDEIKYYKRTLNQWSVYDLITENSSKIPSDKRVSENLLAHYKMDGDLTDETGQQEVIQVFQISLPSLEVTQVQGQYTKNRFGFSQQAQQIEENLNYNVIPFPNFHNMNDFSFSFWIKPIEYLNPNHRYFMICDKNDGRIKFALTTYNVQFTEDNWHKIDLIRNFNNNNINIYKNGQLLGTQLFGQSECRIQDECIVQIGQRSSQSLKAFIDDIKIHKIQLSVEQILENYNQENTFPTPISEPQQPDPIHDIEEGLLAFYPLDGNLQEDTNRDSLQFSNSLLPYLTYDRHGNNDKAFLLQGREDYYSIPRNEIYAISRQFSLSTWIKWNESRYGSIHDLANIISLKFSKNVPPQVIEYDEFFLKNAYIEEKGNQQHYYDHNLLSRFWQHITLSVDLEKKKLNIFSQGVQFFSLAINDTYYSIQEIKLGENFEGTISEVRLYDRAILTDELREIEDGEYHIVDIESGVMSHYTMDNKATDDFQNNEDLTIVDSQNNTIVESVSDRFGEQDSSYSLNDENSKITMNLNQNVNLQNFTVSLWAKSQDLNPSASSIVIDLVMEHVSNSQTTHLIMSNRGLVHISDQPSQIEETLLSGEWQAITITQSQGIAHKDQLLYINGRLVQKISIPIDSSDHYNLKQINLGQYVEPQPEFQFQGSLDDLRITSRVMNKWDIIELTELQKYTPTVPIVDPSDGENDGEIDSGQNPGSGDGETQEPGNDGENSTEQPGQGDGENTSGQPSNGDGENTDQSGSQDGENSSSQPIDGENNTEQPGQGDGENTNEQPSSGDGENSSEQPGSSDGENSTQQPGTNDGENTTQQPGSSDGENTTQQPGSSDGENSTEQPGSSDGENSTGQPDQNDGENSTDQNDGENSIEQPGSNDGENITEQPGQNDGENNTEQPDQNDGENSTEQPGQNDGENSSEQPGQNDGENSTDGENLTEQPVKDDGENDTNQPDPNDGESSTGQPGSNDGENSTEQPGSNDGENQTGQPGQNDGESSTGQPSPIDGENSTEYPDQNDGENQTGQPGSNDGENSQGSSNQGIGEDGESSTGNPDNTDSKECIKQLTNLKFDTIDQEFTFPLIDNQYHHKYVISFKNNFLYSDFCFDFLLWIGSVQHTVEVENNKIELSFKQKDAISNGCENLTQTIKQCHFTIQLIWEEHIQQQVRYTSQIKTPNFNDISGEIQIDLIKDNIDANNQIDQIDQSIETQIKFCSNADCSEYQDDLTFVRYDDIYVEFKVLTDGYKEYYPSHGELRLNNIEVYPQNTDQLQNWNEKGRIIYQFYSPFAKNNTLLSISVKLQEQPPTPGRLRNLQQQYYLQKEKDNVGKYVYIQILDKESNETPQNRNSDNNPQQQQQNGEQEEDYFLYILFSSLFVILIVSLALILVFYKLKKQKQETMKKRRKRSNQYLDRQNTSSNQIQLDFSIRTISSSRVKIDLQ